MNAEPGTSRRPSIPRVIAWRSRSPLRVSARRSSSTARRALRSSGVSDRSLINSSGSRPCLSNCRGGSSRFTVLASLPGGRPAADSGRRGPPRRGRTKFFLSRMMAHREDGVVRERIGEPWHCVCLGRVCRSRARQSTGRRWSSSRSVKIGSAGSPKGVGALCPWPVVVVNQGAKPKVLGPAISGLVEHENGRSRGAARSRGTTDQCDGTFSLACQAASCDSWWAACKAAGTGCR